MLPRGDVEVQRIGVAWAAPDHVDEDVDASHDPVGMGDESIAVGWDGDVTDDRVSPSTFGDNGIYGGLSSICFAVSRADVSALAARRREIARPFPSASCTGCPAPTTSARLAATRPAIDDPPRPLRGPGTGCGTRPLARR